LLTTPAPAVIPPALAKPLPASGLLTLFVPRLNLLPSLLALLHTRLQRHEGLGPRLFGVCQQQFSPIFYTQTL
jgi:hypothetical protein